MSKYVYDENKNKQCIEADLSKLSSLIYPVPDPVMVEVGTIQAGASQYVTLTAPDVTVDLSEGNTVTYKPIGVAGYALSGASGSNVVCNGVMCQNIGTGSYATEIFNASEKAVTVTMFVRFIYVRSDVIA